MANSTEKFISKNIAHYRHLNNFTQEKLSEMVNISTDYLSEIERGKKIPCLRRLIKIAEAFEIEAYKLLMPTTDFEKKGL